MKCMTWRRVITLFVGRFVLSRFPEERFLIFSFWCVSTKLNVFRFLFIRLTLKAEL